MKRDPQKNLAIYVLYPKTKIGITGMMAAEDREPPPPLHTIRKVS